MEAGVEGDAWSFGGRRYLMGDNVTQQKEIFNSQIPPYDYVADKTREVNHKRARWQG